MIIGDINNLKKINDSYGHSVGDQYIQLAARVLREALSSEAIIARIGGDEFGIILTNQEEIMCEKICNKINVTAKEMTIKKDLEENLSISLGCAIQDQIGVDGERLFNEADQKMYEEKALLKKK